MKSVAILGSVLFTLHLSIAVSRAAGPLDSWAEYPRPTGAGPLTSITFGNGVFVAAGLNTLITSTNGMDWTSATAATSGNLRVRFVHDRFFVFGSADLTSTNGTDWGPVSSSPGTPDFSDMTYDNGTYYGQSGGKMARSTDLTNWTVSTAPEFLWFIAAGNGNFAANQNPYLYPNISYFHSSDGDQWTTTGISSQSVISEISFQNGLFTTLHIAYVFQGGYGTGVPKTAYFLSYSTDGSTWQRALSPSATAYPVKVAAGGEYWVVPVGNAIYYSSDLTPVDLQPTNHWTQVPLGITAPETQFADVAFGNNVFVAATFGKIFKSNPVSGTAPLRILHQPESFSANVGGTVTFTVAAQGGDPMTFQWRHAGTNLIGATNNILTLSDLTVATAGEYDVVITNPFGSVTSEKALLSVLFADVKLYSGVTLRGRVGDTFSLEFKNELENPETWHSITNVTLTQPESIWIDYDSPSQPNRFYRVKFLEP